LRKPNLIALQESHLLNEAFPWAAGSNWAFSALLERDRLLLNRFAILMKSWIALNTLKTSRFTHSYLTTKWFNINTICSLTTIF